MGIFGWDLPPGCSINDIPGNRPEDMFWESVIDGFWDKKRDERKDKILSRANTPMVELIDEAIEYGMGIGQQEERKVDEENKYYESAYFEERLSKASLPKETIQEVMKIYHELIK